VALTDDLIEVWGLKIIRRDKSKFLPCGKSLC
jgi:hypothetical protein